MNPALTLLLDLIVSFVTSSVVSTQKSSGFSSTKLQVSKHKLVSNTPFKKILKERRRGMETCRTPVS